MKQKNKQIILKETIALVVIDNFANNYVAQKKYFPINYNPIPPPWFVAHETMTFTSIKMICIVLAALYNLQIIFEIAAYVSCATNQGGKQHISNSNYFF